MKSALLSLIIPIIFLLLFSTSFTSQQKEQHAKDDQEKIIGADISFLPQLEDEGIKFNTNGVQKDAIGILKDNGFNYIRLRIFVNPEADSGYFFAPTFALCLH